MTARTRTRIGSDEARAWVRKLRLGNPYAKAILMALANYMNEEGSAYPGIATLHLDTDIAPDTIIGRLRWCEGIGAIVVFKKWVDEDGKRNGDGRGRPTSNEVRFLFDADLDEIAAKAADATRPRSLKGAALASHEAKAAAGEEASGSSRLHGELNGENSSRRHGELNSVSSRLAIDQLSTGADRTVEVEEDSPPNPPQAWGVCDSEQPHETSEAKQAGEPSEAHESFKPFGEVYPAPVTDMGKTIAVWSALTQGERADAIRGARGYRAFMEAERRRGSKRAVKDAHRWLRDKLWLGYLDTARQIESAAAMKSSTSAEPEGRAWLALHSAVGAVMPYGFNREPTDKFQIPDTIPPAVMAFADLVNVRGVPDKRSWNVAELGTEQAAAWSRFFTDTIKRMPRIENHDGRRGFLVPWAWPPRKDGSTGPPTAPSISEDELQEFR